MFSSSHGKEVEGLYLWRETGNKRDKPLHGPFVAKLLNDLFGIQARGGCACAGPFGHRLLNVDELQSLNFRSAIEKGYNGVKPGWTRVSFPYYMSREEFEFILAAIEFIAVYGQRFLPLYHFSWRKGAWIFKQKKKKALTETDHLSGFMENDSNFCGSPVLATMTRALNMQYSSETEEHEQTDTKDENICMYAKYLEAAKHVASFLPKFPPPRRIPEAIDADLVPFRV